MTYIDTNYFLRYLIKDNAFQQTQVEKLFINGSQGKIKLFTSTLTFFEIFWVLRSCYLTEKDKIISLLSDFLNLSFIELTERKIIQTALAIYEKSTLSLEDSYHLAYAVALQATSLASFDKKLLKTFSEITKN